MRAGGLWVTRVTRVGGAWFRPPLGGRCRSETGAPSRSRSVGVRGDRLSADAGRRPAAVASWGRRFDRPRRRSGDRRSTPFVRLGVRGLDRLSAVDAGRRPALQAVRAVGCAVSTASRRSMPVGDRRSGRSCGWGCVVSTASRRSMPVGDRRSGPFALSWGCVVSTACRRSMPVGDRRSQPFALAWFLPPSAVCRSETGAPAFS